MPESLSEGIIRVLDSADCPELTPKQIARRLDVRVFKIHSTLNHTPGVEFDNRRGAVYLESNEPDTDPVEPWKSD